RFDQRGEPEPARPRQGPNKPPPANFARAIPQPPDDKPTKEDRDAKGVDVSGKAAAAADAAAAERRKAANVPPPPPSDQDVTEARNRALGARRDVEAPRDVSRQATDETPPPAPVIPPPETIPQRVSRTAVPVIPGGGQKETPPPAQPRPEFPHTVSPPPDQQAAPTAAPER